MQPEGIIKTDLDIESPQANFDVSVKKESASARSQSSGKGSAAQNDSANGQFPPPKTDKPRPHVCGTCGRSFARLEHLKRHERSHTKEKPFECPECTRCFARRDLLLRHQQKLHATNTTSSKPRGGRRESVSGTSVSSARVRKNSMATGSAAGSHTINGGTHRPRANTIGHIDLSGLSFLDVNPNFAQMNGLGVHTTTIGMNGLAGATNYESRGMLDNLGHHGLPKLDISSINNLDLTNSLHTAPPYAYGGFDVDQLFNSGTTINPAQLHFGGPMSAAQPNFPTLDPFNVHQSVMDTQTLADDLGWTRNWNMQLAQGIHEQAIDESSPSRMSSGDSPPDDLTDSMANSGVLGVLNSAQWATSDRQARPSISSARFQLAALGNGLPSLDEPAEIAPPENVHVSPPVANDAVIQQMIAQQQQLQAQRLLHQQQQQAQPSAPALMHSQSLNFAPSLSTFSDSPSMSSSSMNTSARQSSVTSLSTDGITDATRQALLTSMSQNSPFGHNSHKHSQPTMSSPLSPSRPPGQGPSLPGTDDIRRYVNAFIQYAHPHLPFMHIPTLSFDFADPSNNKRGSSPQMNLAGNGTGGLHGGAGCLILGMAAIGALYEYDHPASKELFEAGKKILTRCLEDRRKADTFGKMNNMGSPNDGSNHAPLWLVQAMLLSVIYGHQCCDAADTASNHFAALVNLARSACLTQSPASSSPGSGDGNEGNDVGMRESSIGPGDSISRHASSETDLQSQWLHWKAGEERKRTLFAIFIISSLLMTAYNHTPLIMNSEIKLDLPCDEDLWSAETAQEWQNRGGLAAAEQDAVSFAGALSSLLTANQRQGQHYSSTPYSSSNPLGALQTGDTFADNELRPSTFGCLVLINALHNYIWETRSRHHGSEWTPQETQSMFSHIEPALNAWQAAWRANDHHKLERPNPFGTGPLSADCVPLLDLAFVRLFVNLGQSKEAFWLRDFNGMAEELARGSEIVQHADAPAHLDGIDINPGNRRSSHASPSEQFSPRRERHLRKAAFYAADSLTIACNWNLTYADMSAHELPIQSAMCFFDCSQVLAEWACTVQERVGNYLGVLGRDAVDYAQVPAIMMLETEDAELLRKIDQICESLESKRTQQENILSLDPHTLDGTGVNNGINLAACGYGSKILRVTAGMLEKAIVWPVTHVMAKALETQASHMDQRAEASTVQ